MYVAITNNTITDMAGNPHWNWDRSIVHPEVEFDDNDDDASSYNSSHSLS